MTGGLDNKSALPRPSPGLALRKMHEGSEAGRCGAGRGELTPTGAPHPTPPRSGAAACLVLTDPSIELETVGGRRAQCVPVNPHNPCEPDTI